MNNNYSYKRFKYKNSKHQFILVGEKNGLLLLLINNNKPISYFSIGYLFYDYGNLTTFSIFERFNLIPEKIVRDLKLKTKKKNKQGEPYIKNYGYVILNKKNNILTETLNSKIKNILNR